MNLVIIEDSVDMGGVQHSTLNFLKESKNDPDINITILLPGNGPLQAYCSQLKINYVLYPEEKKYSSSVSWFGDKLRMPNVVGLFHNYFNTFKKADSFVNLIKDNSPACDVILTKGMQAHVPGAMAAKKLNVPVVWHVQDYITKNYGGLYRKFFSYLANKHCTHIIADGEPIVNILSNKVQKKSTVVYNGVDVKSFYHPDKKEQHKKELGYNPEEFLIGNVARIVPSKGQLNLVRAFGFVANDIPGARLILVGNPLFGTENYLNTIKAYIEENNLKDKVKITGYINDLTHLYSALDVFVYPATEKDTCPLALLGAMAAGTLVIATRIEGIYEVICQSPDTSFYPKDDVKALAELLKKSYSGNTNSNSNGKANYEYALTHFDNSKYYQSVKTELEKVLLETG